MKRKILLFFVMSAIVTTIQAQKNRKASKQAALTTGYAITAAEKGGRSWREVKVVDVTTGAEVKSVYESKSKADAFNARTGNLIAKKDQSASSKPSTSTITYTSTRPDKERIERKIVNLDQAMGNHNVNVNTHTYTRVIVVKQGQQLGDHPFSTNSAAAALDRKHDRLYYTPMSIAQLRYIDLKSGKVYYFEDEAFGVVKSGGDAGNQITRMAFGSDGNGYALTNNANHLIRFTTGKNPTITNLGALTDDATNTKTSVHSSGGYGGDMVADAKGNLYLITANRNVFKISIETKLATHMGTIQGLPRGFSTNGAMVEEGSKVIVASSESTVGYFRFDLTTMQAERVSPEGEVFNASDLANGNLLFEKKKKDKKDRDDEEVKPEEKTEKPEIASRGDQTTEATLAKGVISVYPNPVTDGVVKLGFSEQPAGRYSVQLLDITGRLVGSKEVTINSESQVEEFRFPELNVKGNYLIRVTNDQNRVNVTNKIVVQ